MILAGQLPLAIPAAGLLATALLRGPRRWAAVTAASAIALWLVAAWGLGHPGGPGGAWDALAVWYILLVCVLSGFCLLASVAYIGAEVAAGELSAAGARRYHLLLHGAVLSLLAVGTAASYLLVWAGVEAATLTTVMLVASPDTERAVEAAWKYVVVTGIGGLLALLGTVLLLRGAGVPLAAWGFARTAAVTGPAGALAVRVGFWLALVGYGSKAGLVPFHTWLPDAHSEAPAPVSALLSGIKLVAGIYGLLRLLAVTSAALGPSWPHDLLIGAGLVSLGLAAAAIAGQSDLKRLLAYSSVEHIGVIALGAGLGGLALAGALLHMWTHGLAKTGLFVGSGNVRLRYGTTGGRSVRGVLAALPLSGTALALGGVAIAGLPPFGLFWSEWLVLLGGAAQHRLAVVAVALVLLLVAVIGLALRLPRFLLGGAGGAGAAPGGAAALPSGGADTPGSPAARQGVPAGSVREGGLAAWLPLGALALLVVAALALPVALHGVWMQAVRLGGG
jgi:hydrogenase-4 component F